MNHPKQKTFKKTMVAIHLAVWTIVFIAPLSFFEKGDRFEPYKIIPMVSMPLMMMAVYYTMYLRVTPRHLFKDDKRSFWIQTALIVVVAAVALHLWLTFSKDFFDHPPRNGMHMNMRMHHRPPRNGMLPVEVWFTVKNLFTFAVTAAIAAMSVITIRWHKAEADMQQALLEKQQAELARQEADAARTEAELKNLRSQINPHFLLNTLNNIYALTAFDPAKAQNAIMELSGMMRHVLYDNQQETVDMTDEVQFMKSYINLMKIRVAARCDIKVDVRIPENNSVKVAPLIFISLIENAFKHGIAAAGNSFISILIEADTSHILCDIRNSNHPKAANDRSGHGIGLEQVKKRLDLSYGGRYSWEKGLNDKGDVYYSRILINIQGAQGGALEKSEGQKNL